MPFDTTPGQVLSSVSSSSDKRRSSKLGGCAGVLFQIFHGKRLFPRKSLPAERPKQAAINFTDDKLPIAKLLLIADENRSGPLKDADEETEVEHGAMVESFGEKAPRRTPGVVARLMGLETMPLPESMCGERKQCELRKNMNYELSVEALQPDKHTTTATPLQQFSSSQGVRRTELKTDLPARFAARQRRKSQDDTAKIKGLPKSPSLPPHHLDASFPSSPKCDSLNKNSMRIRKAAHLLEAAPKMLKANLQPNCQTRSQRLQSSFSGAKIGSLNSKSQLTKFEAQAPCKQRDEVKAVQVAPGYTSNDMISRRQVAEIQKPQLTQQHRQSNIKCSSREATLDYKKHGCQQSFEQPKTVLTEKARSDGRRQDETRRRLSQPTVCSSIKSRPTRHPSPPKSFQDSSAGACSSQASNCMPSSSNGALSSQLKSHVGSNNVSARKHSNSSVRGSSTKLEDADDVLDTMQPIESLYNKVAESQYGSSITIKNLDASLSADPENSSFSQDGSTSSAIYTESLQRSSLESSISSDPSLSEFSTSSEECSNLLSVGEIVAGHKKLQGIKMASDISLNESFSEGLSESLEASSAGHIASSHTQTEDNSRSVDSAHTYSGRNTAAILQELLTALSSSTQKSSSYAKKAEGTVSSSFDSELEKPRFHSAGYGHCKEDLCMEFTFQDSASSTSSDSCQLSQGNEECETNNSSTSKDSASSSEMQGEDGYILASSGTGRTQVQHGLSRDCEALMSTLSKLHHIDPEVIGLKARTRKDPSEQVIRNLASPLSGCLSDADMAEGQTQQLDNGLSSSSNIPADDDADSIYRSDIESSLINGYNEAAVWNKKLVTDCINEAFKSLSKQLYKVSSSLSEPSSATHVLSRVYKQLDEWREMSTNMNLDNTIEKEMNLTTRSWRNIGTETEEVIEMVEGTIFSGLLEEVLLELI